MNQQPESRPPDGPPPQSGKPDTRPGEIRKIAFVGDYLPRRCGIATFTADLCEFTVAQRPGLQCFVAAMNDRPEGYRYPDRVRFEIDQQRRDQYDLAADFLNISQVDVVCVQHEFGIYGGPGGRYLIYLLRQLRSPVVTTLHTIPKEPSAQQKQVLLELGALSDRLVVMSPRAVQYLKDIYRVPESKITMIHHGIPDMPFVDPNFYKDKYGVEGRRVILTFGLLGPDKGIEHAIAALPAVVREYPDIVYVILGATHPHVLRERGEAYRVSLQQQVRQLDLDEHVLFQNRFVTIEELKEYLGSADIYITPYNNPEQIVSGTLAYSMGTGKAVVSTPYCYAEDMLAEGRGRLVPFRKPEAIAETLLDLLKNETERHAMRKRAYTFGRAMVWNKVALRYLEVFQQVREERLARPRPLRTGPQPETYFETLPEFNPKHLLLMTDPTGMLQHAQFTVPDLQHGYTADDNARALVVAVHANALLPSLEDWPVLVAHYLAFLQYAFNPKARRFRNLMGFNREWLEPFGSEDSHARSIWSLAHVVAYSTNNNHVSPAMRLLEQAIPATLDFTSPRAWAYTILAIQTYLRRFGGATAFRRERDVLARRLFDACRANQSDDWPWPENTVTYGNAVLPQALIDAGKWLPDFDMLNHGLRVLDWLDRIQTAEGGHFKAVGTNGFFPRGGVCARFDQQPIEAYRMVEACLTAYRVTADGHWLDVAKRVFEWFLGRNDLHQPLYDDATGGCCDGLGPDRVNENQGAESTLAWLLSLLAMYEMEDEISASSLKIPAGAGK